METTYIRRPVLAFVVAACGAYSLLAPGQSTGPDRGAQPPRGRGEAAGPAYWWKPLLPDAGKVTGGVLLTARLLPGGDPDLAVFVRNVGRRPVRVWLNAPPRAHVSDSKGKFAPLTPDGRGDVGPESFCLASVGSASTWGLVLNPGETRGRVLSLSEDYDLSAPGKYTVIVVQELGNIGDLLTEPLVLKVEKGATATGVRSAAAAPAPVESKDREWSRLAATAGKKAGRFCLEVVPPSVHGGGLYLVASLICMDPKAANHLVLAKTGRDAASYGVLVRDAKGTPLTRLNSAKPAPRDETFEGRNGYPMLFGMGVGAIIPVAEWFDMKKPGQYSVLVWLPSPDGKGPPWVAEPVVVTVAK